MPSPVGVVIGIAAIALLLIAIGRRNRGDLGSVSHTWIIENQSDRHHDNS